MLSAISWEKMLITVAQVWGENYSIEGKCEVANIVLMRCEFEVSRLVKGFN